MSQRRTRTAPKTRCWALLGRFIQEMLPILGPRAAQNRTKRATNAVLGGVLGASWERFGASWGVLGAVLCPCGRINRFGGPRWSQNRPQINPNRPKHAPTRVPICDETMPSTRPKSVKHLPNHSASHLCEHSKKRPTKKVTNRFRPPETMVGRRQSRLARLGHDKNMFANIWLSSNGCAISLTPFFPPA